MLTNYERWSNMVSDHVWSCSVFDFNQVISSG